VKKLGLNVKIPLEENLQGLLDVDLRVVFVWDSDDTCIDLWVNEPDGTKCYYGARSTSMGGFLSRDIMQGLGPNEYFIHKAHPGLYAIAANYYSNYQQSLTGATIVMSKIWRDFGRDNEVCSMGIHRIVTQGETVPLGDITIQ
jgi:Ca-activated chloride channel family protein